MPEFSIIIPVYNTPPAYLRQCAASVSAQICEDFEVILVDDGSMDEVARTCDACAAADARFHVIHKENGGVSSARNAGLGVAEGQWLLFLDPDDWWEQDLLTSVHEQLAVYEPDMLVFGYFRDCGGSSQPCGMETGEPLRFGKKELLQQLQLGLLDENRRLVRVYFGSACLQAVRREIVNRWQLRFDEKLRQSEDALWDMAYLERADSVVLLDRPFYHYRIYETSCYHRYNAYLPSQIEQINTAFLSFGVQYRKGEAYQKAYEAWLMKKYMQLLKMYLFHPDSPLTEQEKKRTWKELCQICPSLQQLRHGDRKGLTEGRKMYAPMWFFGFRLPSYFLTCFFYRLFARKGKV